jgi:antitoxin Phd
MANSVARRRILRDLHEREMPSFTATAAKNSFGALMDALAARGAVAITNRSAPRAVLLSIEEYEGLVAKIPDPLESLRGEFDALVDRMQTPQARKAVDALFSATPEQLGDAAVKEARRRRRG